MLTGPERLARVKEPADVSKSQLVRECGQVCTTKDGSERLNVTAFDATLLETWPQDSAKQEGLSLSSEGSARGKGGRKLCGLASVQGNGNLLVGKQIKLIPGGASEEEE